jgi:flagellar hook protein FlgE
MMRSMFTGVAGLRTHQMKMDVIGNNIANVNTVGFKASSVTFKEMFYQTMQGASAPNPETGRGGTNPMQVGLGVSIASIDNVMTQGAAQNTDNPLDMMINGNTFFIVGDETGGNFFTRAGAFRLDRNGTLVNPAGLKVMGWPVDAATGAIQTNSRVGQLDIKSPANMQFGAVATSKAAFEGNLNIDEGTPTVNHPNRGITKTFDFYDSLGNSYQVDVIFRYFPNAAAGTPGTWAMEAMTGIVPPATEARPLIYRNGELLHTAAAGTPGSAESIMTGLGLTAAAFPAVPAPPAVPAVPAGARTFQFNTDGTINRAPALWAVPNTAGAFTLGGTVGLTPTMLGINATAGPISLDMAGVTQYANNSSVKGYSIDGNTSGDMIGFSVGQDGIITARYSNGREKTLGQIVVASFRNPAGLEKVGDNLFVTTPNSGGFDGIGQDPTIGGGSIGGSRLEMSNVDLAREFTEMITTQRGFQANSRIISTSDEMLQELVRLR